MLLQRSAQAWAPPHPTPTPVGPSQMEKHLSLGLTCPTLRITQVIFSVFLVAMMPERLRQQLGFVPIKCLQSDANGHKLLLRQPRHFASLTYSSLSIFFFKHKHTERSHTMPMCFLLTFFPSRCRGEIPPSQTPLRACRKGRRWWGFVSHTEKGA